MRQNKIFCMLAFILAITAYGGCSPMNDELDAIKGKDGVFALMETSRGNIILELYYKDTPLTVTNFVGLAEGTLDCTKGKHFYDGLKFHRVISRANGDSDDFMIQGGDPKGNGTGGPGYQFENEIVSKFHHSKPGILSMANAGPGTNGSQFFITIVPTPWLDGQHTIFGNVVEGQNIVNSIRVNEIIKKVTIIRNGEDAKKFTATQKDWDNLKATIGEREKKMKEEALASAIKEVEEKYPETKKDSNGIYYQILKEGTGSITGKNKKVSVSYTGQLMDGKVFDSSEGKQDLEFVTNAGRMIPGFDIMVQDMKIGEKRLMVLPPNLGYGERGYPGIIPGNAYIVFTVTLNKVK